MNPNVRRLLRTEGLGVFAAATLAFVALGGPVWLYLLLLLAPDLSMVGYLRGPALGSLTYDAVHVYLWPLVLGGVGVWQGIDLAVLGALVWAAHIGIDRALGYGLKYPTAFTDTHLDRV